MPHPIAPIAPATSTPVLRPARLAVYPGVFDPPTVGHLEIIHTALRLFDFLRVLIASNPSKERFMFSPEERLDLMRRSLHPEWADRVDVETYGGLIAPYAERLGASALVRGMRPGSDPDYEIALSLMNQKLAPTIPTVLLVPSANHVYLSSTFVRDTAQLEGLIVPGSVPAPVEAALRERYAQGNS